MATLIIAAILLTYIPSLAYAHGRMMEPPSRMSAWRFGFNYLRNFDDNGFNCGGFANQWNVNKGKCSICGEPWQGPREYERPNGKFVKKLIITKVYQVGEVIDVGIEVTANHLGWFEFRLCDVRESGGIEATAACLDKHLLVDRAGKSRFNIGSRIGYFKFKLRLPPGLTCPQCVLQWKWHCGNNVGYGERQEEFYACSDVQITADGTSLITNAPITMPPIRTPAPIPVTPKPVTPKPVTPKPVTPNPVPVRPVVTTPKPTTPTSTAARLTYPPPPAYTTPPLLILPPEVVAILTDKTRPLKQRILYFVMYQKAHIKGYSLWTANQLTYVPRYETNEAAVNYNKFVFSSNTNSANTNNNAVTTNTNTNSYPNANTNINSFNGLRFVNKNPNFVFSSNNNNNYNAVTQNNNNNVNSNSTNRVNTGSTFAFCKSCADRCFYSLCATSCPTICPMTV